MSNGVKKKYTVKYQFFLNHIKLIFFRSSYTFFIELLYNNVC